MLRIMKTRQPDHRVNHFYCEGCDCWFSNESGTHDCPPCQPVDEPIPARQVPPYGDYLRCFLLGLLVGLLLMAL